LRINYLRIEDIEEETRRLLRNSGQDSSIPVDVESIIERHLELAIVPILNLMRDYGIDGFTSGDWSEIAIDENIYMNIETRCRSTLGHEIGHLVLHREQLQTESERFGIVSVEDWIRFYRAMDDGTRSRFEYQGYIFSGLLLVPSEHLIAAYEREEASLLRVVDEAKSNGLVRDDYLDSAIEYLATRLAPQFYVSTEVIRKRIENSGLIARIP
jgi:Zn-dependent peptidase ImmA (M78 family)